MDNFPKITVITPVRNAVKTIGKAIESLVAQNYPNLEYIVIDGASTDGTLEVIQKYKKYITYFHSENDNNAVLATINGIKAASGNIIAFLNADDFYEPDTLLKAGTEFAKDQSLDIVSFCYQVVTLESDGTYKVIEKTKPEHVELNRNKIIRSYGVNARFFKKNLFEKYGPILTVDDKNRVFFSNDIEYLIRFTLLNVTNKTIDYIGYTYLSHEDSNTFSNNLENKVRLSEDKIFIAKKFLNTTEFDLPDIWRKTFKKWIIKYRAKLIIYKLKQRKFYEAWENFLTGTKENNSLKFSFYLIKISLRKIS